MKRQYPWFPLTAATGGRACRACCAVLLLLVLLPAASPAWIVFDPRNLVQNLETARQSYLQIQEMVSQLRALDEGVRLDRLNALRWGQSPAYDPAREQDSYRDYLGALQGLDLSLADAASVVNGRYRRFAASGLSWQDYVAREQALAEERDGLREAAFRRDVAALDTVAHWYRHSRKLGEQINATEGIQQSMQTANGHLSLLLTQQTQLLETLSARRQRQQLERMDAVQSAAALKRARELRRRERVCEERARLWPDVEFWDELCTAP